MRNLKQNEKNLKGYCFIPTRKLLDLSAISLSIVLLENLKLTVKAELRTYNEMKYLKQLISNLVHPIFSTAMLLYLGFNQSFKFPVDQRRFHFQ